MREVPTPAECGFSMDDGYLVKPGYDGIAERLGDVVLSGTFGDYTGDYLYLLRDGDRYGFLVQGYGSCSYCDALQSCESLDDVQALIHRMYDAVVWKESADEFLKWVTRDRDWQDQWVWREEGTKRFVGRMVAVVSGWSKAAWDNTPAGIRADWLRDRDLEWLVSEGAE